MHHKPLNNILYAEDEPDIQEIAKIALEDVGGFSVTYCNNGIEILEKIKIMTPDLFLLDVMMPEMDGPTTLQELRKLSQFSHTPAIFMTAKVQPDELELYKNLGVLEVISKPFDPMKLAETIQKAWGKKNE